MIVLWGFLAAAHHSLQIGGLKSNVRSSVAATETMAGDNVEEERCRILMATPEYQPLPPGQEAAGGLALCHDPYPAGGLATTVRLMGKARAVLDGVSPASARSKLVDLLATAETWPAGDGLEWPPGIFGDWAPAVAESPDTSIQLHAYASLLDGAQHPRLAVPAVEAANKTCNSYFTFKLVRTDRMRSEPPPALVTEAELYSEERMPRDPAKERQDWEFKTFTAEVRTTRARHSP